MTVCDRHHPHKTSAALHYSSPFSFLKSKTSISKHFSKKKSFAVQYHSVYCIKTLKKSQFTKKNRIFAHHSTTHFYPIFGTLANANIMYGTILGYFQTLWYQCGIFGIEGLLQQRFVYTTVNTTLANDFSGSIPICIRYLSWANMGRMTAIMSRVRVNANCDIPLAKGTNLWGWLEVLALWHIWTPPTKTRDRTQAESTTWKRVSTVFENHRKSLIQHCNAQNLSLQSVKQC